MIVPRSLLLGGLGFGALALLTNGLVTPDQSLVVIVSVDLVGPVILIADPLPPVVVSVDTIDAVDSPEVALLEGIPCKVSVGLVGPIGLSAGLVGPLVIVIDSDDS